MEGKISSDKTRTTVCREIQTCWEVPAVAHFFYVFRKAFKLIYFEIAELESALLSMQDPDISISCEQIIMRLLQGFENELVTPENWESNLRELFDENLDDCENPFDGTSNFSQLTPRQKLDILYKLCEMRLEVEGASDEIKDIRSDEMRAKCLGKDQQNNLFWYFYDERLYKENPHPNRKKTKVNKEMSTKSSSNAFKQSERSSRENPDWKASETVESPWSIACFTLDDWDKLIKQFSKSRSLQEKHLVAKLKAHIPLVEASVSERDHKRKRKRNQLLRKWLVEFAPKRQSSRVRELEQKREEENAKRLKLEEQIAEKQRLLKLAQEAQTEEGRRKAASDRAEKAQRFGLRIRAPVVGNKSEEEAPKIKQSEDSVPDSSNFRFSSTLRLKVMVKPLGQSEGGVLHQPTEAISENPSSKCFAETNLVIRTSSRLKAKTDALAGNEKNCKSESPLMKTRSVLLLNDTRVNEKSSDSIKGLDSISEDLRMIQSRCANQSGSIQPFVNVPVQRDSVERKVVSALEKPLPFHRPSRIETKKEVYRKLYLPASHLKGSKSKVKEYKCIESDEAQSHNLEIQNGVQEFSSFSASSSSGDVARFRNSAFSKGEELMHSKENKSVLSDLLGEGNEKARLGPEHSKLTAYRKNTSRNITISGSLKPEKPILNVPVSYTAPVSFRRSSRNSHHLKQYSKGFKSIVCLPVKSPPYFFKETSSFDKDTQLNKMNYGTKIKSNSSDLIKKPSMSKEVFKEKPLVPREFLNQGLQSLTCSRMARTRPRTADERPQDSKVTKFPIIIRSYKTGSPERLGMIEL